jgi:hypothetical protein
MTKSDDLDRAVLDLVSRLLPSDDALLVQKLWRQRAALMETLQRIHDWDVSHSEALSLGRAMELVDEALQGVED